MRRQPYRTAIRGNPTLSDGEYVLSMTLIKWVIYLQTQNKIIFLEKWRGVTQPPRRTVREGGKGAELKRRTFLMLF